MFYKSLIFCLFLFGVVNALLIPAGVELPKARVRHQRIYRSLNPALIPVKDHYDDNRHFRKSKSPNIYVYIPLDSASQLLKNLEKLPLQSVEDNDDNKYESNLLAQEPLAMLPLVNYETNENDIDSYNKETAVKEKEEADMFTTFSKLFDSNGMLYLTEPKDNPRKSKRTVLRVDDTKLNVLNKYLNDRLDYERQKPASPGQIYKFSDLVL